MYLHMYISAKRVAGSTASTGPVGRWLGSQPILSIWLNAIKYWQTLLRQGKELVSGKF